MKCAHLIKLSVFSYEDENSQAILDAFLRFFPFNLEDNQVFLKKTDAAGFNERKIRVLEAALAKDKLINGFLRNLLDKLDENQKKQVIQQAESRLDKNLDFFLKLDARK